MPNYVHEKEKENILFDHELSKLPSPCSKFICCYPCTLYRSQQGDTIFELGPEDRVPKVLKAVLHSRYSKDTANLCQCYKSKLTVMSCTLSLCALKPLLITNNTISFDFFYPQSSLLSCRLGKRKILLPIMHVIFDPASSK